MVNALGGISNWGALYIDFAMLGLILLILTFYPENGSAFGPGS
jgi:hypothetical protein